MINAELLGRRIAEAIVNEAGPCFYPGKFKPPHKGHYEAAKALAAKDYITKVYVIISRKVIDGITPEDSLMIWNMYLKAEPNPKITVRISTEESPVVTMIQYLQNNPEANPVYVAVGEDEVDDVEYGKSLQQQFGDRVKTITVQEKAGEINAPHVRNILATGDFEAFKEAVPEAAYNKGAAPKIFKMLAVKVKGNGQEEA
jgi:nicotinamide mononucleotide adenylyltransferase